MPIVSLPADLEFIHLPQIAFRSEEEKKKILIRSLKEFKQGRVDLKELKLGQKYRKKIESAVFPRVSIRYINERIGYGVFAEEPLKKGQWIGEYTGIVRENIREYFVPLNNYCYEYPVPDSIGRSHVIDATQGNFTRFINHSNRPNLKPFYAYIDGLYHMILISIKDISKGEQFSYDYGPKYWYIRSPPEIIE